MYFRIARAILILASVLGAQVSQTNTGSFVVPPSYILSTFNGTNQLLLIMYSTNTVNWWNADPPATLVQALRDPSIVKISGQYWLAATGCVVNTGFCVFGPSATPVGFTGSIFVDISGTIPGAQHTWAPEWFIDPADGSVHLIVTISTQADFNNCCFLFYEMHPTNGAFTTWSAPVQINVTGIGTENPIDAFVVALNGSNTPCQFGQTCTYYLWWKAQSQGNAGGTGYSIGYATGGSALMGAYTLTQNGGGGSAGWNWAGFGVFHEAPTLLFINSKWRIFVDFYQNSFTLGDLYYSDFASLPFASPTALVQLSCPQQCKHGTVIP